MSSQPVPVTALVQMFDRQRRTNARESRFGKPVMPASFVEALPIEQWDTRKHMALLLIDRSAFARDCIEHLKDKKLWPRQEDFAALRAEGFAFKRELARFHELTPTGKREALAVAKYVARELGLHHVYQTSLSDSVSAKCTCGWSTTKYRKHFGEEAALTRAVDVHLANPMAWKRADNTDAIISRTVAKIAGGHDG